MTHFKKSLAVLLAIVMIFSSMSVAASAAFDPKVEGGFNLDFQVKFFRMERNEDGLIIDKEGNVVGDENDNIPEEVYVDEDVNWIETDRAKPGEHVKARVYIGTDFYTYSANMALLFDSRYLDNPLFTDGGHRELVTNGRYMNRTVTLKVDSAGWYSDETQYSQYVNDAGKTLVDRGIISSTYFDDFDIIANSLTIKTKSNTTTLMDVSQWAVEYDLEVYDNELTRTVNSEGTARVPKELAASTETGFPMFINFPKGEAGTNAGFGMYEWDAKITSQEGKVTTTSNIILNANGGYFEKGSEYAITEKLSGIVGDTVKGLGASSPKKDDFTFAGWSEIAVPEDGKINDEIKEALKLSDEDVSAQGGYITEAQIDALCFDEADIAALEYGYKDVTLYAVWKPAQEGGNFYTYKVFYMLPDGTYSDTPSHSQEIPAANGSTASLPKTPVEGYTLDLEASDVTITVKGDKSSVLNAYYARNKYTVNYNYTDNSGVPQVQTYEVLYGADIPAFDSREFPDGYPAKEGYTFEGWETEDGLSVPKKMPAENVDIVPVYEIKKVTYIYDATQGGKFESNGERTYSFVYNYGDTPEEFTEEPVFPGKAFLGWSEKAPEKATSDITFVADYTDVEYTVTFMNGNETVDVFPFFYGDVLYASDVPEGYTAEDSWYIQNEDGSRTVVEFPYTVTDNVVLNAMESADVFDAEFYVDGVLYKAVPTVFGEEIVAPKAPEKEGYNFIMWDPEVGVMDEQGKSFDAVYEIKITKITFVDTGETEIAPIEGAYNSDITAVVPTPEKTGYAFKGWNTPVPSKMPAEDLEITAIWAKNTYSIRFENHDGSLIDVVTGEFESKVTAPALPVEAGYTFAWDKTVPDTMPAENMLVKAVRTPNKYSITFDTNGGVPEEIAAIENVDCGAPIEKPDDPQKDGFEFGGWALVTAPTVPVDFPEKMPANGLELIAIWNTGKHDAYFNANGGKFADGKTIAVVKGVEYGAQIAIPGAPEREGYTFEGWSPVPAIMANEDMYFDAVWIPVSVEPDEGVEYIINVITINPVDGSEITTQVATGNVKEGGTVEVIHKGEAVTADHSYTFEDLIDSVSNVLDEDRTADTKITVTENGENVINIYCKLADVSVTFLANGGKFEDGSDKVVVTGKYGEEIEVPADPERTGYKFNEWDKDPEGATFTTDDTYVAQWEEETYYAIFNINGKEFTKVPYKFGEKIEAPKYTPAEDETFSGWDIPANTVMGPGDMTFDAELTVNEYTLTYSYSSAPAGAQVPASEKGLFYGDTIELAEATDVAGYTFNGWVYDGVTYAEGDDFTMPNGDVTVVGSYTAISYDVNYDTVYADVAVPDDAVTSATVGTVFELPVLSKDGYEFKGWKDGNVSYAPGASFTMPAGEADLEAIWEEIPADPEEYTYTYSWTGDIPASAVRPEGAKVPVGTTVTVADAPVIDGYTFSGWKYNGKLTESFVMPGNDVTITGEWTKNPVPATKYELKVDANGGAFANGEKVYTAQLEEGQTVTLPAGPTYEGFKFIGWVDGEGNATSIPGTMPANAVSIKAEWSELYDITFNVDDKLYETVTDAGVEGDPLPVPEKGEPEKDGFTFGGWADEDGNIVTTIPDGNTVLDAVWVPVDPTLYTIKYYDGTTLLKTEQYEAGKDIAEFSPEDKKGYTFNGWKDMPEDKKMPAEDLVVHAEWLVNKNDITLNAGEGIFEDGTSIFTETDVAYGEKLSGIVPAEPTRDGYTFTGWVDSKGNSATIPATMPDAPIDLTATWKIKSATVTFDAGEGKFADGTSKATASGDYGTDINLPEDPTREGFNFKGWSGLPADGKIPAADITVTAIWEAKPETKTYKLTIDAAGGTIDGEAKIEKTLKEGEAIGDIAEPVREGFKFTGWDKDIPDTMPANDLTVTATWEAVAAPTHTVTYYLNKGDSTPYATKTFEEGETMEHPVPEAAGIVFKNEWVDAEGNALPATMGNKDLVAYAVIDHLKSYKATYIVDGTTYQEYDVTFGAKIPAPTDPSKEGYLFAGWTPSAPATMPAEDLTFTAEWEKVPTEGEKYAARFVVDGTTHELYILEEGEAIPTPDAPTKFGYVFVGWEPEIPSAMPGKDMTFEAQWEIDKDFVTIVVGGTVVSGAVIGTAIGINAAIITGASIIGGILVIVGISELVKHTHTVTFMVDGEVYKTYKVVEGTKIPVPADPEKDGQFFKGWDPEIPEKMGNEDLTFEAQWASETDVVIPDTGSAAGLAAFAAVSAAAAAAFVLASRKKKDEE